MIVSKRGRGRSAEPRLLFDPQHPPSGRLLGSAIALLMITLSCETHGGASFGSLKSLKRHGDENCAKVIKRVKAECAKPMSCALCVGDAAMESFAECCEGLIRHTGNKLRRLPNSQHDWFCMTRHLLAHYGLDRPFLESVAHLKQTSFALSQSVSTDERLAGTLVRLGNSIFRTSV